MVGFLFSSIDRAEAHHLTAAPGVLNDFSNTILIDARDARQEAPLVCVGSQ
jgi:hypothetical protein